MLKLVRFHFQFRSASMIHLVNKLINFGFTRTDAQVYISLLK
ncbi:TrmB family transcriptional regulator, partial [Shigella boydii]